MRTRLSTRKGWIEFPICKRDAKAPLSKGDRFRLTVEDLGNLCSLAGFEYVSHTQEVLLPVPLAGALLPRETLAVQVLRANQRHRYPSCATENKAASDHVSDRSRQERGRKHAAPNRGSTGNGVAEPKLCSLRAIRGTTPMRLSNVKSHRTGTASAAFIARQVLERAMPFV